MDVSLSLSNSKKLDCVSSEFKIVDMLSSFLLLYITFGASKPYESTAIVSRVARGSPAEASGLKAGDQIIAINQKPVKSMTFLEVSNFLRSGSDQSIELTLIHKAAQNHKEYNGAIMVNELPDSNALILSSMANGVERISSKDTNIPSDCGTTDEGYGGGGVAVEQGKVTSDSGANKASSFFYLQLKGEIESDLISLNLFSKCLAIYRPGTLLCSRVESRPVERVFQLLLKPVAYMAPTLLTTPVDTLAQAMARAPFSAKLNSDSPTQTEKSLPKNIHILENHDIFSLAKDDGSA
ncbi:unnamed protein product [Trichobilharzia regenti]|nr:unnamed protein product [Trichobilharzia regenti]